MIKNRIREHRKSNGLTQLELAQRTGVTRQTIGLIETGEFNPSIKLCLAICDALNVTLNDLFWIPAEERRAYESIGNKKHS